MLRGAGLRLRLHRGDLTAATAGAIVTSANDSLVGNRQPTYWRFISRVNADGLLRKKAGPELEAACLAIEPLPADMNDKLRRDITRWTSGVKHGASKPVRCPAGSAVVTPAFGDLPADHIIHAVAPDSEFGYEGMYTGGLLDQVISGAVAGNDTPTSFAGGATDGLASQQFTPPDGLLLGTYDAALARAEELGVGSVALCALGTGVKGWKPSISAALALEAVNRRLGSSSGGGGQHRNRVGEALPDIDFVLGGFGQMADECWRGWVRVARELLGPPSGLERPEDFAQAAARGELCWDLGLASEELPLNGRLRDSQPDSGGGGESGGGGVIRHPGDFTLDMSRIPEMREMWAYRQLGKNGKDEPLTAEQELAAVKRRSTR